MNLAQEVPALPGAHLDLAKMPGHWLLARMGKRVLRPGGLELTHQMLEGLAIAPSDRVVELAPGLGTTARLTLQRRPASYTAVERDPDAAANVRKLLRSGTDRCIDGTAAQSGLPDAEASVVYAEAMLTMHSTEQKAAIIREAFRVLAPGGRFGIHELGLHGDGLDATREAEICRDLSRSIHVGARPLPTAEWRRLVEAEGFRVEKEIVVPMYLLEPRRLIRDEGLLRSLRIIANIARTPAARRRVLDMRSVFHKHMQNLCAVSLVARKPR